MDAAFFEVGAQKLRPALRFGQRFHRRADGDGCGFVKLVSGKGENRVQLFAGGIEPVRRACVANGLHGFLNEGDDQVGAAVPLLPLPERLEKPVALRHSRHGIVNAEPG